MLACVGFARLVHTNNLLLFQFDLRTFGWLDTLVQRAAWPSTILLLSFWDMSVQALYICGEKADITQPLTPQ